MHRIALALAVVAMFLAPPGLAQAQLGGPNVPTPLTEPPPPAPVDSDLEDEGLSSLQQTLIFVAAGLVLAAIALVILRDARRAAPDAKAQRKGSAGGPAPKPGSGSKSGPGAPPAPGARAAAAGGGAAAPGTSASAERARERQRAKRAKAKAKAARQQRKRNRPH